MLWNNSNAGMALEAQATQEVAGPLGIALQDRRVKDPKPLDIFIILDKYIRGYEYTNSIH